MDALELHVRCQKDRPFALETTQCDCCSTVGFKDRILLPKSESWSVILTQKKIYIGHVGIYSSRAWNASLLSLLFLKVCPRIARGMLLQVIVELAALEDALPDLFLVLVRCNRVLLHCIPMSVFNGFWCLQVRMFFVLRLHVTVRCWPGRGRVEIVVLICESGSSCSRDDHPYNSSARHQDGPLL